MDFEILYRLYFRDVYRYVRGLSRDEHLAEEIAQETFARALGAVERARAAFAGGLTPDAVLADVEDAMNALGELTGRTAKEDIVSAIFSRFCVGK